MRSLEEIIALSKCEYLSGNYDAAVDAAEAGLEAHPDAGRLWEMRGVALQALGDFNDAIHSLERASLLVPLSSAGQLALAAGYCVLKKKDLARSIYIHLARHVEVKTSQLSNLAKGLRFVDELGMAAGVAKERIERDPENGEAYFHAASYLTKSGGPAEEIESLLRKAIELDSREVLYRIDLALFLERQGRIPEAYDILVEMEPERLLEFGCPPRMAKLAAIFEEMGDEVRRDMCRRRLAGIREARADERRSP